MNSYEARSGCYVWTHPKHETNSMSWALLDELAGQGGGRNSRMVIDLETTWISFANELVCSKSRIKVCYWKGVRNPALPNHVIGIHFYYWTISRWASRKKPT